MPKGFTVDNPALRDPHGQAARLHGANLAGSGSRLRAHRRCRGGRRARAARLRSRRRSVDVRPRRVARRRGLTEPRARLNAATKQRRAAALRRRAALRGSCRCMRRLTPCSAADLDAAAWTTYCRVRVVNPRPGALRPARGGRCACRATQCPCRCPAWCLYPFPAPVPDSETQQHVLSGELAGAGGTFLGSRLTPCIRRRVRTPRGHIRVWPRAAFRSRPPLAENVRMPLFLTALPAQSRKTRRDWVRARPRCLRLRTQDSAWRCSTPIASMLLSAARNAGSDGHGFWPRACRGGVVQEVNPAHRRRRRTRVCGRAIDTRDRQDATVHAGLDVGEKADEAVQVSGSCTHVVSTRYVSANVCTVVTGSRNGMTSSGRSWPPP